MTVKSLLQKCCSRNCLLVGMGNVLRADDGFGPFVIEKLRHRTSLDLMDSGTTPENFLHPIIERKPSQIIIIDALSLDDSPGTLYSLTPQELDNFSPSTHAPSLDLFAAYIKQHLDTEIHIIGAVPAQLHLGQKMSPPVLKAALTLVSMITDLYPAHADLPPN